jgi:hypothetical protein
LCSASASSRASSLGLQQLIAGDGQLATQIEKLVLNFHQQRAHTGGHVFAQQHADIGIQLVDIAHGVHAQAIFGDTGVVAQAGGAVVTGAGGDLCEAVAHSAVSVKASILAFPGFNVQGNFQANG